MSNIKRIKVKDLIVNWELNPRGSLDEFTYDKYVSHLTEYVENGYDVNEKWGQIIKASKDLYVIQGCHTVLAMIKVDPEYELDVEIIDVDINNAVGIRFHAAQSNVHGLPLTREQKRLAAEWILEGSNLSKGDKDPDLRPYMSNDTVGTMVGCSAPTVRRVRRRMVALLNGAEVNEAASESISMSSTFDPENQVGNYTPSVDEEEFEGEDPELGEEFEEVDTDNEDEEVDITSSDDEDADEDDGEPVDVDDEESDDVDDEESDDVDDEESNDVDDESEEEEVADDMPSPELAKKIEELKAQKEAMEAEIQKGKSGDSNSDEGGSDSSGGKTTKSKREKEVYNDYLEELRGDIVEMLDLADKDLDPLIEAIQKVYRMVDKAVEKRRHKPKSFERLTLMTVLNTIELISNILEIRKLNSE